MDYRKRKYYLISTPNFYIETVIALLKHTIPHIKIHKLPITKSKSSNRYTFMVGCHAVYGVTLEKIMDTIEWLWRYNKLALGFQPLDYKMKKILDSCVPIYEEITREIYGQ